ncbi:hypothetical protein C5O00_07095 [Pukyongia salina]|uniref:Uncharacterized protein n=1 Tax=Pukyongia salina TaxID=2094025 RepID=A0A2S0HWG5_9FLAO|nr:hypothetical protein [Pukyongia salina]AVI50955.1 hypothetical protein C5O00_07095 [Pukyongia salina]
MKSKITLLLLLGFCSIYGNAMRCGDAYQNATYAVEHSEKALASNNLEHLKQYSLRAQEAVEKVFAATENCGCTEANNASYDTLDYLSKALEKDKFEVSRFYVKSALSSIKSILISLDLCNEPDPTYSLIVDENNLITQEQELLAQQEQLLRKQKALEAQLKAQKELQAKLQREKEIKLSEQKRIKFEAEANLLEMETAINRFIRLMDCDRVEPLTEKSYTRTLEQLEVESVHATRTFYSIKAREMADQLIAVLAGCDN